MRDAARRGLATFALVAVSAVGSIAAVSGADDVVISQRDKQFQPASVSVEAGRPLLIVNDDVNTVHHAYVESDSFNFDSGDQSPGTQIRIAFPAKGEFQVLCGIHPKMKLAVHVR